MSFEYSNGGSRKKKIYKPVIKDDGTKVVEAVGVLDLQDEINSHALECNVEYLVSRAINGDANALNQRSAMYGDFTEMPKTYAEMLQTINNAKNVFDNLPAEKKAIFGNDPNKFIASFDDKDFLINAGIIKEPDAEITDPVEDGKEVE